MLSKEKRKLSLTAKNLLQLIFTTNLLYKTYKIFTINSYMYHKIKINTIYNNLLNRKTE